MHRPVLILLLAVLLAAQAAAFPELRFGRAEPNPFSPDGRPPADRDTTWIHYTVTERADSLVVSIAGLSEPSFVLARHEPALAGEYKDPWDGTGEDSLVVDDGSYRVSVVLHETEPVDTLELFVGVDNQPPLLEPIPPFAISPISPEGDGYADELRIGLRVENAVDDLTSGFISTRLGALVASMRYADDSIWRYGNLTADSLSWKGESINPPLEEGLYYWQISTVDQAENRDLMEGAVHVDLYAPTISVDQGFPQGLGFSQADTTFLLRGSAEDTISGVGDVELSPDNGLSWIDIFDGNGRRVEWQYELPFTPNHGAGSYTFLVRATDGQRHSNRPGTDPPMGFFTVVFDATPPEHLGSLPTRTHWRDGELIEVVTTWSEDSLAISADFTPIDPNYVAGSERVDALGAGAYALSYQLPTQSGIGEACDLGIALRARDGANPAVLQTNAFLLTLDNIAPLVLEVEAAQQALLANGDTLRFWLRTDGEDHEISVDFGVVDSQFSPGQEQVLHLGEGRYEVVHAISLENQQPDQRGVELPILVRDPAGNSRAAIGPAVDLINGSNADLLDLNLRPSVLDTRRDSLWVELEIWQAATAAQVLIQDASQVHQRTLLSGPLAQGSHLLSWDGRRTKGEQSPDGLYHLVTEVRVGSEDVARETLAFRIDTVAPRLTELFYEPAAGTLTPDADLLNDTLFVSVDVIAGDDAPTRTAAEIYAPGGQLAQRLELGGDGAREFMGSGVAAWAWGGAGATADGDYRLRLLSRDETLSAAGDLVHLDSLVVQVPLDHNGPKIQVDGGDTARYAFMPIERSGRAIDPGGILGIEHSIDGGSLWTAAFAADSSAAVRDTVDWAFALEGMVGGTVHLLVRGSDTFGHITGKSGNLPAAAQILVWDDAAPLILRVRAENSSYSARDTIRVSAESDDPHADISVDLSRMDSAFNAERLQLTHVPGSQVFLFDYVLSDANSRPPGRYPVVVRANDGVYPAAVDSTLRLRLDRRESIRIRVPARWDAGDQLHIEADAPGTAEIEIYNLAADLVWTISLPVAQEVFDIDWDRRNREGERLRSGPYLCRITVRDASSGHTRSFVRPTFLAVAQ